MQPTVRDTTIDDVATMVLICRHPLVQPHQFKLGPRLEAGFRHLLTVDRFHGGMDHRFTSIEVESKVVGYITHGHYHRNGKAAARLGWNLHPDYWGRGIMPAALTILFDRCSQEHDTQLFSADCFRQNARCKRVLAKLGFYRVPIGLIDRIVLAMGNDCFYWIERFHLDTASRP